MIIFAFVCLGIVIIVTIVLLFITRNHENGKMSSPGLFQKCDGQCEKGLVCDTGVCKVPLKGVCAMLDECESSSTICTGICEKSRLPTLHMRTVCEGTLVADSNGVCKISLGNVCQASDECADSTCIAGRCASRLLNGEACVANVDCKSNNCSFSVCQDPFVNTGSINSACKPGVPSCADGLACSINYDSLPFSPVTYPTCQVALPDVYSVCSKTSACPPPYYCVLGCCTLDEGNKCTTTLECSKGYVCSSGVCITSKENLPASTSQTFGLFRWSVSDVKLQYVAPSINVRRISCYKDYVLLDNDSYIDPSGSLRNLSYTLNGQKVSVELAKLTITGELIVVYNASQVREMCYVNWDGSGTVSLSSGRNYGMLLPPFTSIDGHSLYGSMRFVGVSFYTCFYATLDNTSSNWKFGVIPGVTNALSAMLYSSAKGSNKFWFLIHTIGGNLVCLDAYAQQLSLPYSGLTMISPAYYGDFGSGDVGSRIVYLGNSSSIMYMYDGMRNTLLAPNLSYTTDVAFCITKDYIYAVLPST
jgi:hypothetical protein